MARAGCHSHHPLRSEHQLNNDDLDVCVCVCVCVFDVCYVDAFYYSYYLDDVGDLDVFDYVDYVDDVDYVY